MAPLALSSLRHVLFFVGSAPAFAHQVSESLQPLSLLYQKSGDPVFVEVSADGVKQGPTPGRRAPPRARGKQRSNAGGGDRKGEDSALAGRGGEADALAGSDDLVAEPSATVQTNPPKSSSSISHHSKSHKSSSTHSSTHSAHSSETSSSSEAGPSSSTTASSSTNATSSAGHSKAHSSHSSTHSKHSKTSSSATSSQSKDVEELSEDELEGGKTAPPTTTDPYMSVDEFHDSSVGALSGRVGSLPTFLTGLATSLTCMVIFICLFSSLRLRFPLVYQHNFVTKSVPFDLPATFFGWLVASYRLRMDDVTVCAGLDQALFLEFMHFGMWLFGTLAVPLLLVMGPIHSTMGGNTRDDDQLGRIGMGNVSKHHPWLYWVHAFLVWFVVATVQRSVFWAQARFLERRRNWLKAMPIPRATTILVRDIPRDHCTDEKLKAYFNGIFDGDVVESVHIVKKTSTLCELLDTKMTADLNLQESKFKESQTRQRPTTMDLTGSVVDSISHYSNLSSQAARRVKEERKRIKDAAENGDETVYTDRGFVTFKSRRDSEMALKVTFQPGENLCCEIPPDPADVIYSDLRKCSSSEKMMKSIGYLLMSGVFFAYLPIVLGIAYFMNIHNVALRMSSFRSMAEDSTTATIWNALVGSLSLMFVVSFVPRILNCIFSRFFILQAQAWLQHKVQGWFFWFLVCYVLLITAIGSSVATSLDAILAMPASVIDLLAATMPFAIPFYLTLLPLQWSAHTFGLLRLVPLFKFLGYRSVYEDEQAKELCEPEGQAYNGIGSRSARVGFVVVLALVYCQLTPLINVLCFAEMLVCRLAYGYLVVFAETRKPDLGGEFWVTNLMNIQRCMRIYIILMTGVLCVRDQTYWPCLIAGSSYLYWNSSFNYFSNTFCWESLPLEDIMDISPKKLRRSTRSTYAQPELCED